MDCAQRPERTVNSRPGLIVAASAGLLALSLAAVSQSDRAFAQSAGAWVRPVSGGVSAGFFDPGYLATEGVNHIGVDLPAAPGTSVLAPVSGTVVRNVTDRADIMQAWMAIRDSATGQEHVLGHIASNLRERDTVQQGQRIGVVRDWGSNSHVHWGVNAGSIGAVIDVSAGWGWGRAPADATRQQALSKGWLNALGGNVRTTAAPVSAPAEAPTRSTARSAPSPAANAVPPVPRRLEPGRSRAPGDKVDAGNVRLTWDEAEGADGYDVMVRDLTANRKVEDRRTRSERVTIRGEGGHTYLWNVRACNQAGCSAYSPFQYFTVVN